jgi:hypothetical protein
MCDIIIFIFGLIAVITGKFSLTRKRIVRGLPARIVGILLLLPLPLSFATALVMGTVMVARNQPGNQKQYEDTVRAISTLLTVLFFVAAIIVSICTAKIELKKVPSQDEGTGDDPLGTFRPEEKRRTPAPPPPDDRFQKGSL